MTWAYNYLGFGITITRLHSIGRVKFLMGSDDDDAEGRPCDFVEIVLGTEMYLLFY